MSDLSHAGGEPGIRSVRRSNMGTSSCRSRVIATCLLALALSGCGTATAPGGTGATRASVSPTADSPEEDSSSPDEEPGEGKVGEFDRPPPVTVRYGEGSIDLKAYSYCFGNICINGGPTGDPPDVGSPDEVLLAFPLDGWSFEASFAPAGKQRCPRSQTVRLRANGDGTFLLRPVGYADTYDVTLFGRGDGDLATVFRWSTPSDGPLPKPKSQMALVSGDTERITSYGVELSLSNLATTPDDALAKITVTAANGESLSFAATRARGCQPEGSIYWDGPDGKGLGAAELGSPPFTYDVVLMLDGERYQATARWPDDEIRGDEPSVALDFHPALPALG